MAVKRKNNIENDNSNSDNESISTTTTTTTSNKINKTDNNSKDKIDDNSKQEIFKILSNDNIQNLKENEVKEWISSVANQLLNNVVIYINGQEHMLVEIEFYFKGYNHIDEFTHADSMQLERGTWYFHRTNGAGYKGGSFKGMDITFGCGNSGNDNGATNNSGAYGGILIRSLQNLSDNSVIDGPSLCVDHVLKLTNSKDIASFVNQHGRSIFQSENPLYYMKLRSEVDNSKVKLPNIVNPNDIVSCARVGLTFKRYKKGQEYFIAGNYRYIRLPDKVKKGKHYMTVALALAGKDNTSIKNIIGSTAAAIEKIKSQIKTGESKSRSNIKDYKGDLSTDEICQLLALCNKLTIERDTGKSDQDNDDDDSDNNGDNNSGTDNESQDD